MYFNVSTCSPSVMHTQTSIILSGRIDIIARAFTCFRVWCIQKYNCNFIWNGILFVSYKIGFRRQYWVAEHLIGSKEKWYENYNNLSIQIIPGNTAFSFHFFNSSVLKFKNARRAIKCVFTKYSNIYEQKDGHNFWTINNTNISSYLLITSFSKCSENILCLNFYPLDVELWRYIWIALLFQNPWAYAYWLCIMTIRCSSIESTHMIHHIVCRLLHQW